MNREYTLRALDGHAQRFALVADASGGEVAEVEGGLLVYIGPGLPNSSFFRGETPDHEAVLDAARSFFGRRETDFVVCARRGLDDLAAPSFREIGCMAMSPVVAGSARTQGLEIEETGDLDAYFEVSAAAFEETVANERRFYPPGIERHPAFRFFIGRSEGRPVATAGLISTGAGAGVYGVSTLHAHRRRGFATAMTTDVLGRAGDRDLAFLQPTNGSVRLYERLGFRTVGTYLLHRQSEVFHS